MSTIPTKAESQAVQEYFDETYPGRGEIGLTEPQTKEFGAWLLTKPKDQTEIHDKFLVLLTDTKLKEILGNRMRHRTRQPTVLAYYTVVK